MRMALRGILLALSLFLGYLLFQRLPVLQEYRRCYVLAYQVLNDEHLFVRGSYISDEALCRSRKTILLESATCFQDADQLLVMSDIEKGMIDRIAQLMARGNKAFIVLVEAHNEACPDIRLNVRYDAVSGRWF